MTNFKKTIMVATFTVAIFSASTNVDARKSSTYNSYSSKSSPSYGTGSKSSSANVKGYTKQNGTYVAPSKRSTPD